MLVFEVARPQLYRPSMGRSVCGAIPSLPIKRLDRAVGETFFRNHFLQSGKPMPIVAFAIVRVAGGLTFLDFLAEEGDPILPREDARLVEGDDHGEGPRFPWLPENRPILIDGDMEDRRQCRPIVGHA